VSGGDRVDLVVRAPRILTMSELGIIEDGCVAVSGGVISYVGGGGSCPKSEERLDLAHHLLMPGLIDSHAYTYLLAAGRSSTDILGFRPGPDALYWSALFAYTTMLLSGVTTVRDSAHDPSILERAAQRSGIRVVASRLVEPGEDVVPWSEITIRAMDGWSSGSLTPGTGRVALDVSDLESPFDVGLVRSTSASIVAGASIPLGAARVLKDSGVGLVITPSQALRGRWTGGILRMRSVGVDAALGTGIRSLYAIPNLLDEARIALHLDAMGGFDPNPSPLIESMTSVAGSVLGGGVGRIAPGFRADMIALDLRKPHLRFPSGDLSSTLLFSANRGDFDYVLVNGEIVVEDGRHRWLYPEGIARKLESVLSSSRSL
jgi:cytosine/adenosine deaminase-related metal-dependent hydrolase